jgi:hypothetical protein
MRLTRVLRYRRPRLQLNRFFWLCLTFCQLACQQKEPLRPAPPYAFFPLTSGTTWKYQITDESRHTTTIFTDKVERTPLAGSSSQLITEDGRSTAASETIVSETSGSDGTLLLLYKTNSRYITRSLSFGGLQNGFPDDQMISTESAFLPLTLKPGMTWSNTTFPFGSMLHSLKIVQTHVVYSEDGVVSVPSGHFSNCMRIETNAVFMTDPPNSQWANRYLKYLDWYAPNVGLIKTTLWQKGLFGREIARVELIQFRHGSFAGEPPRPSDGAQHKTATHPDLMD